MFLFFFFKQKTAYEMRISDWSSDVCSSDLIAVSDHPSLDATLALFDSGVDDVVRKPVHPREILARAAAIRRRLKAIANHTDVGQIRVFSDGREDRKSGV